MVKIPLMLHRFSLPGREVRAWQDKGESYEHVLLKIVAYFMFFEEFPDLEIEKNVGLRYKPDLVSISGAGSFGFWGECGRSSTRKLNWVLKHTSTEKLVLFKTGFQQRQYLDKFRASVPESYRRNGRVSLYAFTGDLVRNVRGKKISSLPKEWFRKTYI